jgi:hypothetical protein
MKAFTKEEIDLMLESISNISHVSFSDKSLFILKNKENSINDLIENLLASKEKNTHFIHKKHFSLMKNVLDLNIKIYSEDEIQTYTGKDKYFIERFIKKLIL